MEEIKKESLFDTIFSILHASIRDKFDYLSLAKELGTYEFGVKDTLQRLLEITLNYSRLALADGTSIESERLYPYIDFTWILFDCYNRARVNYVNSFSDNLYIKNQISMIRSQKALLFSERNSKRIEALNEELDNMNNKLSNELYNALLENK